MLDDTPLRLRIAHTLSEISAEAWNVCACGDTGAQRPNPFVSHEFLYALEASGSVGPGTGWTPAYALVESETGSLLACAPSYIKGHSQGEYVFDHAWADAYQRAGGRYYPKIQVAAPFSPVTGPRLLVHPAVPRAAGEEALLKALHLLRQKADASSLHITFLTEAEVARMAPHTLLERNDLQFHWKNNGYSRFDDFLDALSSRKRKSIRKERQQAVAKGISIVHLTGSDLTPRVWDAFYSFYIDTGSRKWGRPYLTRAFFDRIGETMADQILLVMAMRDGRPIAGAINFIGQDTLYGRNWGCVEDHPFLHFEVCYYQAIDYAIAHGLARVEAGAQGEHKLARGYLPVRTYSLHAMADSGFHRAVADYLVREKRQVEAMQTALLDESPYRKDTIG